MSEKLAKAMSSQQQLEAYPHRKIVAGLYNDSGRIDDYHSVIKACRNFYHADPIAGTVLNRMSDMAITELKNVRQSKIPQATIAYYDAIAEKILPFLKIAALEYMLHGMVIPAYTTSIVKGNEYDQRLGRKDYEVVDNLWIRNPDNIRLVRTPIGNERIIMLKIPKEDIDIITGGDTTNPYYIYLVENFPDYVRKIKAGASQITLDNVTPIFRKLLSYNDYPIPFLTNALEPLQHKQYLKNMDRAIAARVIEAIRQVKVGNDTYPATDEDIADIENKMIGNGSKKEFIYNLFTNHTIEIKWIFPDLEVLINETKYAEPNADIFLAMGFPRVLTTGETLRSNSSDSKVASLGPTATLEEMRLQLINWVKSLYKQLADLNGFNRYPDPYFTAIRTTDITALIQFAFQMQSAGIISKNTVAQLYGKDYAEELEQMIYEYENTKELDDMKNQDALEKQQALMEMNSKFQQPSPSNTQKDQVNGKPAANNKSGKDSKTKAELTED